MQPITVNSQLSLKQYYNISMYFFYRKKITWYMTFIFIIMLVGLFIVAPGKNIDLSSVWICLAFCIYYLLMPLLVYWGTYRNYKKIKATSESKFYEFDEDNIKLESKSITMRIDWSHIDKVKERKSDFLILTSNGRAVHFLPKNGFTIQNEISDFSELIKNKKIKSNIK